MIQSEDIKELAAALSKAQGVMAGAAKDTANPFFKTKYADLASVWDAARKPLSDNGLSVCQTTKMVEGEVCLITTLMHSSGQWIAGEMWLAPVKRDPQGYGSAITYMRRYALAAIVGVAPEDDDGNDASKQTRQNHAPNPGGQKEKPPVTNPEITPEEKQRLAKFTVWFLDQVAKATTGDAIDRGCASRAADFESLKVANPADYNKIMAAISAKHDALRFPPSDEEARRDAEMRQFDG